MPTIFLYSMHLPPESIPVIYASGGMATVFLGALQGALGFRQLVAIKRPHPHLIEDPGFRDAWLREARLAAGIHHANVVDVRDIEVVGDAIQLVMDYIEGASLGELVTRRGARGRKLPPASRVRMVLDAARGCTRRTRPSDDDGDAARARAPRRVAAEHPGRGRRRRARHRLRHRQVRRLGEQATREGSSRARRLHGARVRARRGHRSPRRRVRRWAWCCGRRCAGKRLFRGRERQRDARARAARRQAPPVVASPIRARAPRRARRARARGATARRASRRPRTLARALEQVAGRAGLIATHADVGRYVREQVGERLAERRRALRDAPRSAPSPVGRDDHGPRGPPRRSRAAKAASSRWPASRCCWPAQGPSSRDRRRGTGARASDRDLDPDRARVLSAFATDADARGLDRCQPRPPHLSARASASTRKPLLQACRQRSSAEPLPEHAMSDPVLRGRDLAHLRPPVDAHLVRSSSSSSTGPRAARVSVDDRLGARSAPAPGNDLRIADPDRVARPLRARAPAATPSRCATSAAPTAPTSRACACATATSPRAPSCASGRPRFASTSATSPAFVELSAARRVRRARRARASRCAGSTRCSSGSRPPTRRCSSRARPARARTCVARSLHAASPRAGRPLRRGRLRRHPREPHRERAFRPRARRVHAAPCRTARASSRRPRAARSSSTRSARCRVALQPKLLRAIESRTVRRVGASDQPRRRRAHRGRHEPTARALRERGDLPRGPLLPARRRLGSRCRRCVRAARTSRRWRATSTERSPGPGAPELPRRLRRPMLAARSWPGNVRELRELHRAQRLARPRRRAQPPRPSPPAAGGGLPSLDGDGRAAPAAQGGAPGLDRELRERLRARGSCRRAAATSRAPPSAPA